jgi:hypothetical protein
MILVPINNETAPVRTKHICWYTKDNGREITLFELVENFYEHPQAPDCALFPVYETVRHNTFIKGEHKASPLTLMQHMQATVSLQFTESHKESKLEKL